PSAHEQPRVGASTQTLPPATGLDGVEPGRMLPRSRTRSPRAAPPATRLPRARPRPARAAAAPRSARPAPTPRPGAAASRDRDVMAAAWDRGHGEEHECASHVLVEPSTPRAVEAPLELLVVLLTSSDRRERVHGDLGLVEALGELERTPTPDDRLLRRHRVLT